MKGISIWAGEYLYAGEGYKADSGLFVCIGSSPSE